MADIVVGLRAAFACNPDPTLKIMLTAADEIEWLREEAALLHALQAAGVDNWEGYEQALDGSGS